MSTEEAGIPAGSLPADDLAQRYNRSDVGFFKLLIDCLADQVAIEDVNRLIDAGKLDDFLAFIDHVVERGLVDHTGRIHGAVLQQWYVEAARESEAIHIEVADLLGVGAEDRAAAENSIAGVSITPARCEPSPVGRCVVLERDVNAHRHREGTRSVVDYEQVLCTFCGTSIALFLARRDDFRRAATRHPLLRSRAKARNHVDRFRLNTFRLLRTRAGF